MNGPADQLGLVGALAYAEPGDVLVVGTEAYLGTAVIGDLMAGMLLNCGAAGPGHRRRGARHARHHRGWACRSSARASAPTRRSGNGPGTVGLAISIGGVTVNPGDILVGDVDGVVVVPQGRARRRDRPRRRNQAHGERGGSRGQGRAHVPRLLARIPGAGGGALCGLTQALRPRGAEGGHSMEFGRVSTEEAERFREDGFLFKRGYFDREEIALPPPWRHQG